jgi:hypothetical protein
MKIDSWNLINGNKIVGIWSTMCSLWIRITCEISSVKKKHHIIYMKEFKFKFQNTVI